MKNKTDKDMTLCEALKSVSDEIGYRIFTCEKCGRKIRIEAPHLTEAQAKRLHRCREVGN